MTDDEYCGLALQIGQDRLRVIYSTILLYVEQDDENGFVAWRLSLPEHEQRYIHESANRHDFSTQLVNRGLLGSVVQQAIDLPAPPVAP